MRTNSRIAVLTTALTFSTLGQALGQGETTLIDFTGSARQADSLVLTPSDQDGEMTLIVDDTVDGALVMVTSSSKTLTVSLVDPSSNETFVGSTGPGISGSMTFPEDADSNPDILGKDYVFRLESPAAGSWTIRVVETALLADDLVVVTNTWIDSPIQGFLVGGGEDYPPTVPVRLGVFMMDDSSYLAGHTIDCQVFRLGDATFTPVAVTFADDGVSPDFAAADGLYTGEISLSTPGDYDVRATVDGTTPGGAPYERDLFGELRIVTLAASLVPSTVSDQPVDADADGLIDEVVVSNDVDVVTSGDYVVQVDLESAGGAGVSRTTFVTLGTGTSTVGVHFEPDALLALGEDGPYAIEKISLVRILATGEEVQHALYDVGSTAAYDLSDLERDPILVVDFVESADDCDVDGDYDRLILDVYVDVLTPGSHQYSTTLTDAEGNDIVFFNGTRSFTAGTNVLHFVIDAFLIAARGGDGPYSLSSALILGPTDSLVASELGSTQAYLHEDWQAPPTTIPVFADFESFSLGPVGGQMGWTQTAGADPTKAIVTTAAPRSGAQAVELHVDPFLGAGATWGIFSPLVATDEIEQTVELGLRFDGSGGPSHDVLVQSPTAGSSVAWIRFASSGDVLVYQPWAGSFAFVSTGYHWIANVGVGTYLDLSIRVDSAAPVSSRVLIEIDGITVFTGPTLGSAFVEQVAILTDNTGPDVTLHVDDVVVTNRDMRRDCNNNGLPDACDVASGTSEDCNSNGVPDECDPDCDNDNIPNECEADCNANGTPDDCENITDCNANGVPDECEPDCDADGIPDECEPDCDLDYVPDDCEPDCDGDGEPDECESDCDHDGVPDDCEEDCDVDGIPDDCESDCDGNGTPNDCDVFLDCNGNGILDSCDIAEGTSDDDNGNWVPDECEVLETDYCFCADGICGNDDPSAGCANSTGVGAILTATGTSRVSADDLFLTMSPLSTNKFGLFFQGTNTGSLPFGDGYRCISGQLFRYPVVNSGSTGVITFGPIVGWANSHFPNAGRINNGETWHFQGWYRDPMGPCGTGFNLTHGKSIIFTP